MWSGRKIRLLPGHKRDGIGVSGEQFGQAQRDMPGAVAIADPRGAAEPTSTTFVEKSASKPTSEVTATTETIYPGEKNGLPFDVVVINDLSSSFSSPPSAVISSHRSLSTVSGASDGSPMMESWTMTKTKKTPAFSAGMR